MSLYLVTVFHQFYKGVITVISVRNYLYNLSRGYTVSKITQTQKREDLTRRYIYYENILTYVDLIHRERPAATVML